MTEKIRRLPPHVADLIAAGEVVERPASAAKELIENSIDAKASAISVETRRGGVALLRVTDDGCGMSAQDAPNAFLRHATSKIHTAEDLHAITTLGFRGEALAALAAVSRIELQTREHGATFGTSLILEGGEPPELSEAGCPAGTTVIVRDLFFNTPARQKFLKKDVTEGLQVQGVVVRAAQSHPEIAFALIQDGREVLRTPGNGELSACLHALWGRDASAQLVPVYGEHQGNGITGFIGRPSLTRGSREQEHFFVNGRPVRSRTITAALEEAFRHSAPNGRYPVCSLHITMPEMLFDVNVHPAKLEVKFVYERTVFELVYAGVRDALQASNKHPEWSSGNGVHAAVSKPADTVQEVQAQEPAETEAPVEAAHSVQPARPMPVPQSVETEAPGVKNTSYAASRLGILSIESPVQAAVIDRPEPPENNIVPITAGEDIQTGLPLEDFRYVGEVLGGFLLVEQDDTLVMIDKHAAHERFLFDRYKAGNDPAMVQTLMTPAVAVLSPDDCAVLAEHSGLLEETGLSLDDFGGGSIAVRTVPEGISTGDLEVVLSGLARLLRGKRRDPWEQRRAAILEMMACKAAVKVGRRFSEHEALEVVRWVMRDKSLWHCPHGRPVAVVLTRSELFRQFGR